MPKEESSMSAGRAVKVDPAELEEAKEALERIRDDLGTIHDFFRRNVSKFEYERLKAYGLANAYIGLFKEHDWVAREEDSIEAALEEIEADEEEDEETEFEPEEEDNV